MRVYESKSQYRLLSYYDLLVLVDIHAILCGLASKFPTSQVIPYIRHHTSYISHRLDSRGLCSVNPFEIIDKVNGQLRHERAARFQMVAVTEGIVNAVYIVFTAGMGIAEGKIIAVRHNNLSVSVCEPCF